MRAVENLVTLKRHQEALSLLDDLGPEGRQVRGLCLRAACHIELGQYREGLVAAEAAIASDPEKNGHIGLPPWC